MNNRLSGGPQLILLDVSNHYDFADCTLARSLQLNRLLGLAALTDNWIDIKKVKAMKKIAWTLLLFGAVLTASWSLLTLGKQPEAFPEGSESESRLSLIHI